MLTLRYGQICHKLYPKVSMACGTLENLQQTLSLKWKAETHKSQILYHNFHTLSQTPVKNIQSPLYSSTRNQIRKAEEKPKRDIVAAEDAPFGELSTSQKVKRAGKDATYTVIVIAGIAVTGALFFAIGRELLSGQSPSGIYGRALKLVRKHEDIIVALGEPIKGYGETSRRGRRRHVNHFEYEKDGVKHMRMKFYVEGPAKKGTVHLEAQQDGPGGKYQYRYLFVTIDDYPSRTIIIEDNRATMMASTIDSIE